MFFFKRSGWLKEIPLVIQEIYLPSSHCWERRRSSIIETDIILQRIQAQKIDDVEVGSCRTSCWQLGIMEDGMFKGEINVKDEFGGSIWF